MILYEKLLRWEKVEKILREGKSDDEQQAEICMNDYLIRSNLQFFLRLSSPKISRNGS